MLKKHMAACLVVTAFAAAPALAQTSTTPSAPTDRPAASGTGTTSTGSPAMQPGASGSSSTMNQSSSMSQGGMQGQFMTKMEANHVMASDLIGTRVVGANNESIGDINDVIMDRNGQIMAAVVGVGGFLGIGEKDVAVPFKSLEFMNAQQAQAMNNNNGGNNNVATTGSTTTGGTATTGAAGSSNQTAGNTNASSGNQNQPERVVLRMTKDQLQSAPAFNQDGDNANTSTTGSAGAGGGQSGTTTAPRP